MATVCLVCNIELSEKGECQCLCAECKKPVRLGGCGHGKGNKGVFPTGGRLEIVEVPSE